MVKRTQLVFSSPAPQSVGEGDRSPKSEWWKGRAVRTEPVARPLHHPVFPGWSPSPAVFAAGEEQ
jgi:hypothetical protein